MNNKEIFIDRKVVTVVATFCCLLWGSAYPSVKIGYKLFNIGTSDISSKLVFAGYRFILAGLIVLIIQRGSAKKILALSKGNILSLIILGIGQTTLQYVFFYIGLSNTTGVKGAIMNATGTIFSVGLAHYIYKNDKLKKNKIIGCLAGFIGVMIVNLSSDLLNFSFVFKGEGFLIIAAFIFSISTIYGKKLTQSMNVMIITGANLFIGGIILTILGFIFGGRLHHITLPAAALLTYMALLSAMAFSLWTVLLKYNKVGKVSVFNFLIPVSGAILSSILLGESIFELKNIVALFLVCFGIWLVNKEKIILI